MNRRFVTNAGWAMILVGTVSRLAGPALAAELTLAREGSSQYRIVIPAAASETEKRAAAELQSFLKQISRAELPVVADDAPRTPHEIILGNNRHLAAQGRKGHQPALPLIEENLA